jgi:hypothetical protein
MSLAALRSSASIRRLVVGTVGSGELHAGQRLAKPGLSGFNSNSSAQTAQIFVGKAIYAPWYDAHNAPKKWVYARNSLALFWSKRDPGEKGGPEKWVDSWFNQAAALKTPSKVNELLWEGHKSQADVAALLKFVFRR